MSLSCSAGNLSVNGDSNVNAAGMLVANGIGNVLVSGDSSFGTGSLGIYSNGGDVTVFTHSGDVIVILSGQSLQFSSGLPALAGDALVLSNSNSFVLLEGSAIALGLPNNVVLPSGGAGIQSNTGFGSSVKTSGNGSVSPLSGGGKVN
jgi:hypothetical protein